MQQWGITSNLKDTGYSVLVNNADLENGQIPKESRIKIDKLFTLDKSIVKKKVAKVNKNTFERVKLVFSSLI